MSLRYSGPATLHCNGRAFTVYADLSTNVGSGVYSWGGRLHSPDIAAMRTAGQGGTLTLTAPPPVAADVHVTMAEPHPGGGVQLRVNGHDRAPYERDGEITATPGVDGATVYQVVEGGSAAPDTAATVPRRPRQGE